MTKVFASPTVAADETGGGAAVTEKSKEVGEEMVKQPVYTIMPPQHFVPLSSVHLEEPSMPRRRRSNNCSTSCLVAAIVFTWIAASAIIILYFGPECIFGKRLDLSDEKASTSQLRFIYDFAEPEAKPTNPQLPTTGQPINIVDSNTSGGKRTLVDGSVINNNEKPRVIEIDLSKMMTADRGREAATVDQLPVVVVRPQQQEQSASSEEREPKQTIVVDRTTNDAAQRPALINEPKEDTSVRQIPFQYAQIGGMRGILVPAEAIFGRTRPTQYQGSYYRPATMVQPMWAMQQQQQQQQQQSSPVFYRPMPEYNPFLMARLQAMRQRQMMMMQQQYFEQYPNTIPRFAQAPPQAYYYRSPYFQQQAPMFYDPRMMMQQPQQPQQFPVVYDQERAREMFARRQQLQRLDPHVPVQMEPEGLHRRNPNFPVIQQQPPQGESKEHFDSKEQELPLTDRIYRMMQARSQEEQRQPSPDEIFRINQARAQAEQQAREREQSMTRQPTQDEIYRMMQARAQEEQKEREQSAPRTPAQPNQDEVYRALQAEAQKMNQQQQQVQRPVPAAQPDDDAIFRAYQQQAMQMQKNQQPQAPMQLPVKFEQEMNNETKPIEAVVQTNPVVLKVGSAAKVEMPEATTAMPEATTDTAAFPDITSTDETPPQVPESDERAVQPESREVNGPSGADPSDKISDYFKGKVPEGKLPEATEERKPEDERVEIVDGRQPTVDDVTPATIETSSDAQLPQANTELSPAMKDFAHAAVAMVNEPVKEKNTPVERAPIKRES